jgi:sorbitol/mannitol transport system permease protein
MEQEHTDRRRAVEQRVTTETTSPEVAHRARLRRERWTRRLPLLPALLFTIVVTQIPFLMNLWYSLTEWKITPPRPRTFTGFDNYATLFTDTFFRSAVWVTTAMTVGSVV